jgi:hypothetical protein
MGLLPTFAQILPAIPPSQDDHGPSSALSNGVKVTESQGARSLAGDVPLEVPMRESSPDTPYGGEQDPCLSAVRYQLDRFGATSTP